MSKILVTGGAGFVGTNLIKRLLNDGHKVISIDNYSTGSEDNHIPECIYIYGDITQLNESGLSSVLRIHNFDDVSVIYHLAALARIQPSLINPRKSLENNFNGTLNILEFARKNNCQVIYAGSSSKHVGLYGSPYAWSKFGGEELCKLYTSVYGLNTKVCRFYNVYGPHMIYDGAYATVVGIFLKQFRSGKPLTITGDGEQRRDFTHVDDIVDGLIRCMDFFSDKCEFFELGSGMNYSINELAGMFTDYPFEYIPARKGEYPVTLCKDQKAFYELNWKAKNNLRDYIKKEIL